MGLRSRLTTAEDYEALAAMDVHPWHIFALCLGLVLGAICC
ncbi:hypothetical protein [Nesterenkonia pannonica]|nr:hypothetical protein [Nesterenkonia pannonica]